MNQDIYYTLDGEIATIFMNRPEKKNAVTLAMWNSIPKLLDELKECVDVRVVIIRGVDHTAFSAGADIKEFSVERENVEKASNYDRLLNQAGDALEQFPKPIIALIESVCIGGGCEIALACDLRFSSNTGTFGIPPSKIGLVYGVGQTRRLMNAVGKSYAKDMLYSGRLFDAEEAHHIGLINRVFNSEDIVEETYSYARLLASRSQLSIRASKQILQFLDSSENTSEDITRMIEHSYEAKDIKEGIQSFKENRIPNF